MTAMVAEGINRDDSFLYLFAFGGILIVAFVLALAINGFFDPPTIVDGCLTGAVMWLGFVVPTTFYYPAFRSPAKGIWALFMGYQFIAFVTMGALFAIWR